MFIMAWFQFSICGQELCAFHIIIFREFSSISLNYICLLDFSRKRGVQDNLAMLAVADTTQP